jgi:hypothetical protein
MKQMWPLILLLLVSCVDSERVPVEIEIDRGACQGSTIELYLLRLQADESTCVIARGTNELPPMQIADEEVVLLALTSSEIVPDAGMQDSPPEQDTTYSPDAYSPDAYYSPDGYSPDAYQSYCGDNDCDPASGEDCTSCPQDCGGCGQPDASFSAFGLSSCVRCYGLARVTLGARVEPVAITLKPTATCNVPSAAQQQIGLDPAPLPPGDCQ